MGSRSVVKKAPKRRRSVSGKNPRASADGLCGHPTARGNGRPCMRTPLEGATSCELHGGIQELQAIAREAKKGAGGRPPVHGLYRRHLSPEEQASYDDAPVGQLDQEIRLAKSNLAYALAQRAKDPKGGATYRSHKTVVFKPWDDVIEQHQDLVRRLEQARAQYMLGEGGRGVGGFSITVRPVQGVELSSLPKPGAAEEEEY